MSASPHGTLHTPPTTWDGNWQHIVEFLIQCHLLFVAQPKTCKPSELGWPLMEYNTLGPPKSGSVPQETMFNDPCSIGSDGGNHITVPASRKRFCLCICSPLSLLCSRHPEDKIALLYQFPQGLQKKIKDELAWMESPSGLNAFINLAIQINTCLHKGREERNLTLIPPGLILLPSNACKSMLGTGT